MLSKAVLRHYQTLRITWKLPAGSALSMAKARVKAYEMGIEFHWEQEQENPRDVFGEPDPVHGPFYDPDAEFWACIAKDADGNILDSLGMIDGAFNRSDNAGYHYYVECEMSESAIEQAEKELDAKRRKEFSEIFARIVTDLAGIPNRTDNWDTLTYSRGMASVLVELMRLADLYGADFYQILKVSAEVFDRLK